MVIESPPESLSIEQEGWLWGAEEEDRESNQTYHLNFILLIKPITWIPCYQPNLSPDFCLINQTYHLNTMLSTKPITWKQYEFHFINQTYLLAGPKYEEEEKRPANLRYQSWTRSTLMHQSESRTGTTNGLSKNYDHHPWWSWWYFICSVDKVLRTGTKNIEV